MTARISVTDEERQGVNSTLRLTHAARLLVAAVLMNGDHARGFIDVEFQMIGEAAFFDLVVEHHDGFERILVARHTDTDTKGP